MTSPPLARVLVLLATHDGERYLHEQIASILNQEGVDVHVVISDDASTDGTWQLLQEAASDDRITVLPQGRFGSAQHNFYRLIRCADVTGFDAIGFSDQDDIWEPWKLKVHLGALLDTASPVDAVSSDVMAFREDGTTSVVRKSRPQRRFDYIFESGGPGSTFLLSPSSFSIVSGQLQSDEPDMAHDWLIYALIRASGRRWHIDGQPSVRYRQHDANVLGESRGLRPILQRLGQIRSGRFRMDVMEALTSALSVADPTIRPSLEQLLVEVQSNSVGSRSRLLGRAREFRRSPRDRAALGIIFAFNLWN
ncbi:MAG: glycosyltransferase [Agrococcus casei]